MESQNIDLPVLVALLQAQLAPWDWKTRINLKSKPAYMIWNQGADLQALSI